MNKFLIVWFAVLFLAACGTTPHYASIDNSDLSSFNDCDTIQRQIRMTDEQIQNLAQIKSLNLGANALSVGGALLSFNPTLLFDMKGNGNLEEAKKSYVDRLARLKQLETAHCSALKPSR